MAPVPKAVATLGDLMAAYFRDLDAAARDPARKVAWCTSVGPAELLRALGFAVYFPENHAAMLGASRRATGFIPRANAAGYSPEICSYLTSDVGAWLSGHTALSKPCPEIDAVPRPDVLVYNTNQCRDVADWFAFYARAYGVRLLGVASPRGVEDVTRDLVDGVAAQMRALVAPLAAIAGAPLDPDRLRAAIVASREASDLWREVLRTATNRPAPLTFFDGCIHMGPAVVLRGDPRAGAYYRDLLAELRGRVAADAGAVPGERVRLYWEGMPVWGRLRDLSERFASLGASVVASTYCSSWVFDALDPDDPFGGMARASLELFITRTDPVKERILAAEARRFGVDGFVFHDARTCPNNTNSRYGMPGRLEAATGLPTLVLPGDLNDLRMFSDDTSRLAIEAFVEQLRPGGAP
jgi:benzoyl-CoA reductase/2-hydroxyglutaryl-CoA dehydratase subunit BcrC/BadD/HgdB